jgi:hypothetical protein
MKPNYGSVTHRIAVLKRAQECRERRRLYRNYYEPTPFERLAHIERLITMQRTEKVN